MDSTIISELDFSHNYHDLACGFLKRKTSRNQGLTWNNRPNLGLSAASFPCHTERGHLWKSWGVRAWIMKAPLKITTAGGQGETSEILETGN